ncbi:hypothetical protein OIDMADRAFT_184458 [Oidiodendron maius Zn]|uniref:Uncharacterized protein n=1 Tax=Oidiodendron maius (strain Zn) TaxID=913774 RepID=A0A0C3C6A5_OIDMZ|nr:hypothetical protein OIDMADRAFT_184458 [Oidiodendron maius Zn]
MECFDVMVYWNVMAKAALGVLKAIHVPLKKVLQSARASFSNSMSMSPSFDFSSIALPQPIHDFLYNDLSIIGETNFLDPQLANIGGGGAFEPNATSGTELWQFDVICAKTAFGDL